MAQHLPSAQWGRRMRCGAPLRVSDDEKGWCQECFDSWEFACTLPGWLRVVPERTYQVRVAGLIRDTDPRTQLEEQDGSAHRIRTVLVGRFGGQHALWVFLRQLRTYGLEVVDVRRLPHPEALEARMVVGPTVSSWVSDHGGYELTVSGDVDPRLHAALTPYATALEALHTVLRMEVPEDVTFVDLVLLLEARGVKIASIAVVDHEAPVPVRSMVRHGLRPGLATP